METFSKLSKVQRNEIWWMDASEEPFQMEKEYLEQIGIKKEAPTNFTYCDNKFVMYSLYNHLEKIVENSWSDY